MNKSVIILFWLCIFCKQLKTKCLTHTEDILRYQVHFSFSLVLICLCSWPTAHISCNNISVSRLNRSRLMSRQNQKWWMLMAPPWIMALTDPTVCGSSQLSSCQQARSCYQSSSWWLRCQKNSTLCTDFQLLGILAAARHLILYLMDVPNLKGFRRPWSCSKATHLEQNYGIPPTHFLSFDPLMIRCLSRCGHSNMHRT